MKLSNDTIALLSYCTKINQGIIIDSGNKIYSKSTSGSMCIYAEVQDNFPSRFVTSNLQRFLSEISLFEDPDFEFCDTSVNIIEASGKGSGKNKIKFFLSNPALVQQTNRIPAPQSEIAVNFTITSENIKKIFKGAGILNVNDINIIAKDGIVTACVTNNSVSTSDEFNVVLGECEDDIDVTFLFRKEHLNLIDSFDYEVEVSPRGLAKFTANNSPFNVFEVYVITTFKRDDD